MDEASGNFFGKQLLRGYYFHEMPSELSKKFGPNKVKMHVALSYSKLNKLREEKYFQDSDVGCFCFSLDQCRDEILKNAVLEFEQ